MSPSDEELDRHCREKLAQLKREHDLLAKPYIDMLISIEARQPPKSMVVDANMLTVWSQPLNEP